MLNNLIDKINVISRQKSTDAICKIAGQHIVEIFDFDYTVISLFDFRKRKIISKKERSYANKDLGICHPDKWVEESAYYENDDDILLKVLQKKRNIKVVGRHVFDENILPSDQNEERITFAAINKDIFEKYGHSRLARIYIPIIYRSLKEPYGGVDLSLGVIEIGIKEKYENQFSTENEEQAFNNFNELLKEKYPHAELEKLLQLYTDNFAQPCYSATVEEESKTLLKELSQIKEGYGSNSELSYEAYATAITQKITSVLGADYGIIAVKTFNNNYINYLDKGTYFSDPRIRGYLNEKVFEFKNGIFEEKSILVHVCEKTFESYYTDDILDPNFKYVEGVVFPEKMKSEMITPIRYENEIVGVVDLYSFKKAFFNPITVALTERAMELFTYTYMSKKRQHVYNNLIKPTETWNNSNKVYEQLIKLLTGYYYTDTICLWERNYSNNEQNEYKLVTGFDENGPFVKKMISIMSESKVVSEDFKKKLGPDIDLHYDFFNKDTSINRFCLENEFKFYLSLSIKIANNYEVFINIFSKLDIFYNKFNKERVRENFLSRDYEFLSQLSTKISFSLQNLRISEALKKMSVVFGSNSKDRYFETLQNIVSSAQTATGADIVALFPVDPDLHQILKKDGILSNKIINKSDHKAIFADIIFRLKATNEDQIYHFDSNKECKDFLKANNSNIDLSEFDNNGFRTLNNIHSTAAVRLRFDSRPVGVMFFNYKQHQNLQNNNNLRQIILFFSTFAASQIYVNKELDKIKKQNEELDAKYALKEEEIEKMIPLITRTQFYLIVEGVSHIMGNALDGMEEDLEKIEEGDKSISLVNRIRNINNSRKLVNTVLTIFNFRDEKNRKEYVNIAEIINATINFFRIKFGDIIFENLNNSNIPDFFCYKAEFAMIIYNLVYNSISAIKKINRKEGKVILDVKLSKNKANFIITITDNGIGISHENDENIYLANWTSKPKGTGLGLYYIKKTVEGYKGFITHKSVYREKTTFTLTIPVEKDYSE